MDLMVLEITDDTFDKEVLRATLPVLVDFWAPWCGPCRMVGPIVDSLAGKNADKVKFCKLNVDENQQIAANAGVQSIPLLLFYKDGKRVDEMVGAVPESVIRPKVEALL